MKMARNLAAIAAAILALSSGSFAAEVAFYPFSEGNDGASAVGAVSNTRLPVLLIHGEADDFVPCGMSRELAEACAGPVRLETFPGAGHGGSYLKDPERYGRIVRKFLESCGGM